MSSGQDGKSLNEDALLQENVSSTSGLSSAKSPGEAQPRRYNAGGNVDRTKIVQKPVTPTQVDNPRGFQIQQLKRRFSPVEAQKENGSAFTFTMVPSDPDFPFEMAGLDCELNVPSTYPGGSPPRLKVRNKEMGRGYQINVERGFQTLQEKSPQATLLALMNALDKQLESLLIGQKAETVKLIPNDSISTNGQQPPPTRSQTSPAKPVEVLMPPPPFTPDERRIAQARRERETRQLEARLGRLPLYRKSTDGIVYTLPIEPRKRIDLPVPLQAIQTLKLVVPPSYPLLPCRIEILGVSKEAPAATEKGFERKAKDSPEMTLIGLVNHLSQNMHILATEISEDETNKAKDEPGLDQSRVSESPQGNDHDDRSHLKVIPRPPEWVSGGTGSGGNGDDSSDSDDSEDDYEDDASEGEQNANSEAPTSVAERGILLSFPFLELHGIELLELVSLCLTIKCERCKDTMDINNLRNTSDTETTRLRNESCKKCASPLSVGMTSD